MKTNYEQYQKIFMPNTHVFGGTEFMVKNFKEKVMPLIPKIKNYDCMENIFGSDHRPVKAEYIL